MSDLIDRQTAQRLFRKAISFKEHVGKMMWSSSEVKEWVAEFIEDLPSAQPETAKRIVGKSRDGMTLWYQCDMCNEPVDAQDNFCRGCGRRLTDE